MAWENPEVAWERVTPLGSVHPREIESRIGPVTGSIEVLSGGLANLNIRLGNKVLRIYRRDPTVIGIEAALLRRTWSSFRVPCILDEGADFLLLEYVAHKAIEGTREEGAAVGRALAEIHAVKFNSAGFLGADLRIAKVLPDLLETLRQYASAELRSGPLAQLHGRVMESLEGLHAGYPTLLHADWKASNLLWSDRGLLVLDWEFAYAGDPLSDIGQLLRWPPPEPFVEGFAESYGALPEGWRRQAELFDLVNLAGLSARTVPGSRRATDVERRIQKTLRGSS